MRSSSAYVWSFVCWVVLMGCSSSSPTSEKGSTMDGGAEPFDEPNCNALCGHLVEQCVDATTSDDVTSCLRDCEEDFVQRFAICDDEVLAFGACCQRAQRAELCPNGQDADIKRCETACPEEAEELRACGDVIVTCAQVCTRIEAVCGDERDPVCRRECMGDRDQAADAGRSSPFASMLECCMQEEEAELRQLCDEDAFDPCSALCGIAGIEELPPSD